MTEFSVVVPVLDDRDLLRVTLPSYFKLNPSEIILCYDDPPIQESVELCREIAEGFPDVSLNFIFVPDTHGWVFHQAYVRREGFKAACYDRVVTGDIDLVVNQNVLKAVECVGPNLSEGDVGLASVSKFEWAGGWRGLARLFGRGLLKLVVHRFAEAYRGYGIATSYFTGLYCFWRPFWLETEDAGISRLHNPKMSLWERVPSEWVAEDFYATGEDTYLRDCLVRKYPVTYLPDVGAVVLRVELESNPQVQFSNGVYFALKGRHLLGALTRTFLRLEPNYINGHRYGVHLRKMRGLP